MRGLKLVFRVSPSPSIIPATNSEVHPRREGGAGLIFGDIAEIRVPIALKGRRNNQAIARVASRERNSYLSSPTTEAAIMVHG